MDRYNIVRMYADDRRPRIIRKWLDLSQAQSHCKDPKTKKEGVYFDGYEKCTCRAKRKNCKCK